jgi:hypothetical protein
VHGLPVALALANPKVDEREVLVDLVALHPNTLKDQLGLEDHGGRTTAGVSVRILQRVLALTAAIWHNWHTGQPIMRSLTAYDH